MLPLAQQCQFVHTKCADVPGFINPFTLYYCLEQSPQLRHWICIPLLCILLLVLFGSIGLVAGNCLVPNLNSIASHLNIPENISGLTLLAFANGSPDIISTYTSLVTGNVSLALGEIIGAAYFINTVVIGVIFMIKPFDLVPKNKFNNVGVNEDSADMNKDDEEQKFHKLNAKGTYLRDIIFFIVSTLVLLCFVRDGVLTRFEMIILVSIYITYVFSIVAWQWYFKKELSKIQLINQSRSVYDRSSVALVTPENIEFQDSYSYNPQIIRNLEFETILSGITSRNFVRFYINEEGQYRDHDDSSDDTIALNQLQAELIEPQRKSIYENIFDYVAFPFIKLFKHTIPILTVTDYEGSYKPALNALFEMLTSLLISPFIIICTLFPSTTFLTKFLMIIPALCLTYFAYHNLVRSPNPSSWIKCLISLTGVMCSISWISIIASEIISILTLISSLTYIKQSALGITLFALGNSVGDLISCIVITKMGYPLMALAACIGGPLLNILLGLGLNGLLVGADYIEIPPSVSITFCLIGLLINLIAVLLVFIPICGWRCDRYVGFAMMLLWFAGVTVAIVLEMLLSY